MKSELDLKSLSPHWPLELKVALTEKTFGLNQKKTVYNGNIIQKLVQFILQVAFKFIIPLDNNLPADEKWVHLMNGYHRFGIISKHTGRVPVIGIPLLKSTNKLLGRMIIRNQFWDITPDHSDNLLGIAKGFLKFAEGLGLTIDDNSIQVQNDSITIYISKCSAGVSHGYPTHCCRAMGEMDSEVVRQLGGKLDILETIAENGKQCKFRITMPKQKNQAG